MLFIRVIQKSSGKMSINVLSALYFICAFLLALYALGASLLLVTYLRHRHDAVKTPILDQYPHVLVQLPIYNERFVVERLIKSIVALDYPHDKLTIQVLDDSTDDTPTFVAALVQDFQAQGVDIHHVQRENRTGYKAGALAYGLSLVDAEFALVLDADFVPHSDFLLKTIPHFCNDPKLGMVQTRWGHLNTYDNPLTLGQTLSLDGHFVVEQTARNRAGWLINFNGSGGVWRIACIREAGGWQDTTLTEDLDLSYRAQLAGWHFLYLPHVVVPAEIPPRMNAYKQQQARWATGSTQTLVQMLGPVWQAHLTIGQRIMATLHLCQYLPHPLMLLLLLLTPPLILSQHLDDLPLGVLGLAGLGPPLIYVISQYTLYQDWGRRLLAFPVLLLLGTGVAWSNTRAIFSGLAAGKGKQEFRRTPKGAKGMSHYKLKIDRGIIVELMLSVYALWGAWLALRMEPELTLYMMIYGFAFGGVALWSLRDSWVLSHPPKD